MSTGAENKDFVARSRCFRIAASITLVLLGACASPGPPRAPSLNLPQVVTTLTAERVGDEVQLHWSTPEQTTDGIDVRGRVDAVICRRIVASPEQACVPVLRRAATAGVSAAIDRLSPSLIGGQEVEVEYRLELQNAAGHSAGQSNPALTVSGPAPAGLQELHVVASQEGAVLTWAAEDAPDVVELHRVTTLAAKPDKKARPRTDQAGDTDAVLRVPAGRGAVDRTAKMGEHYTYTAQRVRTIAVAAHVSEVRSVVSAPVSVELLDTFAPRPPSGLEAVAGDQGIDLSWRSNTEPDLAGYFVFRQEAGVPAQLNEAPLPGPSFQDKTAATGHSYRYTVVAVDRAGNRSSASEGVQVSPRSEIP